MSSKFRQKLDFFIYWLAFKSLRRMLLTDPGYVYLLELYLHRWNSSNKQLSERVKTATKAFFYTLDEIGS